MTLGQPEKYIGCIFNFGHRVTTALNVSTFLPFIGGTNQATDLSFIVPQKGKLKNLYWDCDANSLAVNSRLEIHIGAVHSTPSTVAPSPGFPLGTPSIAINLQGNKTTNNPPISTTPCPDPLDLDVLPGQRVAVYVRRTGGTILKLRVSFELEVEKASETFQLAGDNTTVFYDGGNVGIGTSTPAAKLEIVGSIKITDGTEQNNRVLTSDGNGLATWKTPTSIPSGYSILGDTTIAPPGFTFTGLTLKAGDAALSNQHWTSMKPMPTKRFGHSICVANGKIYAIGGKTDINTPCYLIEEYDPNLNTWTTKTPLQTLRYEFGACVVNNKIYITGGASPSGQPLDLNEMYDPLTETWTTLAPLITARMIPGLCSATNKIYLIGGNYNNGICPFTDEYDPATNTWSRKTNNPNPTVVFGIAELNNKVFVIGGSNGNRVDLNQQYDPISDVWSLKSPMYSPRCEFGIGVINNKIHVVGGYNNDPNSLRTTKHEIYDPIIDSWSISGENDSIPLPTPRGRFEIAVLNNNLYSIGGYNTSYGFAIETLDLNQVISTVFKNYFLHLKV